MRLEHVNRRTGSVALYEVEDEGRIPEPELGKGATSHSGPLELHRPASLFGGPRLLLCVLAVPRSTPVERLVLNYLLRLLTRRPPAFEVESLIALAAFFRPLPLWLVKQALFWLPLALKLHTLLIIRCLASSDDRLVRSRRVFRTLEAKKEAISFPLPSLPSCLSTAIYSSRLPSPCTPLFYSTRPLPTVLNPLSSTSHLLSVR